MGKDETAAGGAAPMVLAAALVMFAQLNLSNAAFFPLFDATLPAAREVSVAVGMLANLALVVAAMRRPALLREGPLSATCAALSLAGIVTSALALRAGSAALLCAGVCALGLGNSWIAMVCGLARCALSHRALLVGLPLAYGLAQAGSWLVLFAGQDAAVAVMAACPLAGLALGRGAARTTLAVVHQTPPQADAQLLRPQSFLPLTSRLFTFMFTATIALSFNLRFGPTEGDLNSAAPVLAVCLAMALAGGRVAGRDGSTPDPAAGASDPKDAPAPARHPFDTMFGCATALVVAGFLVAPLASMGRLTSSLIAMGGAFVNVLFALVVTEACKRNPASSVCVLGWGYALSSLASIVGANVGAFVGGAYSDAAFLLAAAVASVFLLYVLVGMRSFSFDETIEGIEPYVPAAPHVETGEEHVARVCGRLGAGAGLTPRETEVLALLARGRNNAYIQEELSLTRNTVKTYVKRIYAKLDVHSQQEVIDLVERE